MQQPCELDIPSDHSSLYDDGDNDFLDSDSISTDNREDGEDNEDVPNVQRRRQARLHSNSIKFLYRNETWSQASNEYDSPPIPFSGETLGVKESYPSMPTFLHLFGIFWTRNIFERFVQKQIAMHRR